MTAGNFPFYEAAVELVYGGAFGILNKGDNLIHDVICEIDNEVVGKIDPQLLERKSEFKELKEEDPDFDIDYDGESFRIREEVFRVMEKFGTTHNRHKEEIDKAIMEILPDNLVAAAINSPWLQRVRFSPSNYATRVCRLEKTTNSL